MRCARAMRSSCSGRRWTSVSTSPSSCATKGFADEIVVSVQAIRRPDGGGHRPLRDERGHCEVADPSTTRGEVLLMSEQGSGADAPSVIVVTTTPHVARTRYIFGSAIPASSRSSPPEKPQSHRGLGARSTRISRSRSPRRWSSPARMSPSSVMSRLDRPSQGGPRAETAEPDPMRVRGWSGFRLRRRWRCTAAASSTARARS